MKSLFGDPNDGRLTLHKNIPRAARGDIIIFVSIDVSGGGHLRSFSESEGIDGVGGHGWPNVRLQALTVDDIDRSPEKTGNVFFGPDVLVNPDLRGGGDLDHDVGVAARGRVASGT